MPSWPGALVSMSLSGVLWDQTPISGRTHLEMAVAGIAQCLPVKNPRLCLTIVQVCAPRTGCGHRPGPDPEVPWWSSLELVVPPQDGEVGDFPEHVSRHCVLLLYRLLLSWGPGAKQGVSG